MYCLKLLRKNPHTYYEMLQIRYLNDTRKCNDQSVPSYDKLLGMGRVGFERATLAGKPGIIQLNEQFSVGGWPVASASRVRLGGLQGALRRAIATAR